MDENTLNFYLFVHSTHKKLHNEVGSDGNVYNTRRQAALTAVTDVIKDSVCFPNGYYFFSVGCKIFAIFFLVAFVGEELTVFGFVRL